MGMALAPQNLPNSVSRHARLLNTLDHHHQPKTQRPKESQKSPVQHASLIYFSSVALCDLLNTLWNIWHHGYDIDSAAPTSFSRVTPWALLLDTLFYTSNTEPP
jgi:hypothetical protein